MKIYKHTKLCSVLALLCLGVASCSDSFLNEKPYSDYEAGTGDPSIVENQLIGLHYIYAQLWGWSGRKGFLSCWQIGMDIFSAGATVVVENPRYLYADLDSDIVGVSYLWDHAHQFINNANTIISSVGDENPAESAEARFFRAYAYNTLVTLWR